MTEVLALTLHVDFSVHASTRPGAGTVFFQFFSAVICSAASVVSKQGTHIFERRK